MSKPICLLFALVILTTILCNNSVCSQRRSWKQNAVCGCKIHPSRGLQCRNHHKRDYSEIARCICSNPETYYNEDNKKLFVRICSSKYNSPSMPL